MERRITNTQGTIPANTVLAGTVSTANVTDKFIYTGSDDVAALYTLGNSFHGDSNAWIFVANGGAAIAPYIARVIGIFKNGDANYTLYLDRAFPGVSGATCSYVKAPEWFGFQNDGGADGSVCSGDKNSSLVTIHDGEGDQNKPFQLYVQRTKMNMPLFVDATGTDFLINEAT